MWRVVGIFRLVTLVYAAVLIVRHHGRYGHPLGGLLVLAAMAAWTAAVSAAYARPRTRRPWVVGADVAVAAGVILATRLVETAFRIDHGAPTLAASWAAAPVLAGAVAGGPWAGLAGAGVVSAADLVERGTVAPNTFNGVVLLLITGGVGGQVVRLGLRAEAAVDRMARAEAATAERQRIARGVHDSVLQVLALVSARGRELGGEAAELGRLAGAQEAALRSLVTMAPPSSPGGPLDVRTLLEPLARKWVTVSCPAYAVPLPEKTARVLAAAAGEALENVRRHAGPDARAWVLLEDAGTTVVVSVRDDGAGFAPDRPARAAAEGRLGIAESIVGRIGDVGGKAVVTGAPGQGTEVELRVPRT